MLDNVQIQIGPKSASMATEHKEEKSSVPRTTTDQTIDHMLCSSQSHLVSTELLDNVFKINVTDSVILANSLYGIVIRVTFTKTDLIPDDQIVIKLTSRKRAKQRRMGSVDEYEAEYAINTMRVGPPDLLHHPGILQCLASDDLLINNPSPLSVLAFPVTDGDVITHLMLPSSVQLSVEVMEALVIGLLQQVGSALMHIHSRGYYHGDMSLENILQSQDMTIFHLCDFGMCAPAAQSSPHVCKVSYVAPELMCIIYPEPKTVVDKCKADMYSLGMCVLTMLTGVSLYNECSRLAQIHRTVELIMKRGYQYVLRMHGLQLRIDPQLHIILNGLLAPPASRWTSDRLVKFMQVTSIK